MSRPSEQNTSARSSREMSDGSGEPLLARIAPQSVLMPVRMVSFWMAIAMPFFSLPLLLTGLNTTFEILAFLSLIVLNLAALVLGHGHST